MSDETARVFLGLALGEELGNAAATLVADALADPKGRAWRLPRPEGLHVTLLFLGDIPAGRVDDLGAALSEHVATLTAPRLVLDHTGAFPRRGEERVLWLGVSEEAGSEGALSAIRAASIDAVRAVGLDPGPDVRRPYQPHVTVARPRRVSGRATGQAPDAFFELAPELPFAPSAVALLESQRATDGPPRYVPRTLAPLVAAADLP